MPTNRPLNLTVAPGPAWTELTAADCVNFTLTNNGPDVIFVQATTGSVPANTDGAISIGPRQGLQGSVATNFYGAGAGADRLFAFAASVATSVSFQAD